MPYDQVLQDKNKLLEIFDSLPYLTIVYVQYSPYRKNLQGGAHEV